MSDKRSPIKGKLQEVLDLIDEIESDRTISTSDLRDLLEEIEGSRQIRRGALSDGEM